jgi:hypothetical protein
MFILPLFIVAILLGFYRLDPETDALGMGGDSYKPLDNYQAYGNGDAKRWPMWVGFCVIMSLSFLAFAGLVVSATVGRDMITIGA